MLMFQGTQGDASRRAGSWRRHVMITVTGTSSQDGAVPITSNSVFSALNFPALTCLQPKVLAILLTFAYSTGGLHIVGEHRDGKTILASYQYLRWYSSASLQ